VTFVGEVFCVQSTSSRCLNNATTQAGYCVEPVLFAEQKTTIAANNDSESITPSEV